MEENSNFSRGPFYLSLGTTCLTWVLILMGGVVHITGSSLACPDWPTCHGSFFPEMVGGVFIEHSHRLVASTVGLLSILLALFCWKRGPVLRGLSLFAVILVIFQGVLGGLTVLYELPPAVSTGHLATSMAFLALMIWMTAMLYSQTHPMREGWDAAPSELRKIRGWILITLGLVYLQLTWGGMVRHFGAGLACVDIPLCQGSLWPSDASGLLKIHMAHRLMALVVAALVGISSWKIYHLQPAQRIFRFLGIFLPFLVWVQIGLGLLSVHLALEIVPVTAHLGVGALIWGMMVWVYYVFSQKLRVSQEATPGSPSPDLSSIPVSPVSS